MNEMLKTDAIRFCHSKQRAAHLAGFTADLRAICAILC